MTTAITQPLTLSGRYFSKKDIAYVQQTVKTFSNLSQTELAETLCEHLHWVTAKKRNKINACLSALAKLESLGYISLPVKRVQKQRETKAIEWTSQSAPGTVIDCELSSLGSIQLEVVKDKADIALWNELVDRHHYLGYRHPIGAALKYFVIANTPSRQILGCLQFSSSVWHLADRDSWIGWQTKDRETGAPSARLMIDFGTPCHKNRFTSRRIIRPRPPCVRLDYAQKPLRQGSLKWLYGYSG